MNRYLRSLGMALAGAVTGALAMGAAFASEDHQGFIAACDAAMDRMMTAMHIAPSGDVDRDFVAMMAPHHQGAIDMAIAELRYGKDVRLKRIAQEIIVEQQQEIAAMKLALGDPLPPSKSLPTEIPHPHGETH